jgi:PiT family inorganic phosphate transporter
MAILVSFGIALALAFNFVNGLNNAANSTAIVVATRALSPLRALALAAVCNFAGPFLLTTAVAATIGTGLVAPAAITPTAIVAALICAVVLIVGATAYGFPVSSSHAMVGSLIGAGIAAGGIDAVLLPAVETVERLALVSAAGGAVGALVAYLVARDLGENVRIVSAAGAIFGFSIAVTALLATAAVEVSGILAILLFIVISPSLGFITAFLLDVAVTHVFRRSRQSRLKRIFRRLEIAAAGFQAIGHGANDGQLAVGMITALLVASGELSSFEVPFDVLIAAALAIAAGTCFGGWEVVKKIGRGITKIRPYQGFSASTAGGAILALTTLRGVPVSSTHAISGAIVGVGATRGTNAIRWETVREIVAAWIFTIPLSLGLSYAVFVLLAQVIGP